MKTIVIRRWDTKETIFSHTCENNTESITVQEAVKQKVSLAYADLRNFNLGYANLDNIDLSHADLTHAIFYGAVMGFAKLNDANLEGAILTNASLEYSDLRGADLMKADLSRTDLHYSNLNNANLLNAVLHSTILDDANVDNIITNYPLNLPDGEFIAWKKVRGLYNENYIIKLKILADSKRSRATSNKCRCDKALVLEIQDLDGNKLDLTEVSNTNEMWLCPRPYTTYKVGEIVYADKWDENRFNECTHGIHFFLDRVKAVNY